ncbi:hypothetical protein STANM309S_04839 [Streptomyces tanashiensis]
MCAPSRIWSRAISTQSSQRPSSMASRNFFEPLAFVRSPIAMYEVSCRNGTVWYREAAPGSGRGERSGGVRPWTRSTTWRRCSGVEPQQPPTRDRP